MKVAHVLPLSLSLYGLSDTDIGEKSRFFFTNICEFESSLGLDITAYMISSNTKSFVKKCNGYRVAFVPVDIEPKLRSHKFGHQISFRLILRVLLLKPNIIHFHGFMQHHLMYSILTILGKMSGIKIVAHHQGVTKKRLIEELLTKIADKLVDAIIVTNFETQTSLEKESPTMRDKVVFIPNGVNTTMFYPMDKHASKSRLALNPSDFVILWVGRLSRPQKDAFTVVKAVSKLRSQLGTFIKLVIVGQGEDEKPLKDFASLNSNDRDGIVFVTDYVRHEDLRIFYNAADVFVLNSSHEGMPQVVLEAMACRTPVVLSDVAGNREIANDVGLLFQPNDPEALGICLSVLLKDVILRKTLGDKCYNKAISVYTWEKITKTIVADTYCRLDSGEDLCDQIVVKK
jgi:glycosyltransferase involved in cell wall biosynthesis